MTLRKRIGRAAAALLVSAAAACQSPIVARPFEIAPAARASYDDALERRARSSRLGGDEARAELEAALQSAKAALAAAPGDFRLAVLVQDLEFDLDARAARERYVAEPASTAMVKTLAARALLPERSAEARELLLAACAEEPDLAWARYGLAFVERREGHAGAALADAERALRLDPTLVEALRLLADLYEDGGDRKRAIEAREKLIEVTAGDLVERHRFARLLLDSDSKSDATDAEKELRVILAAAGDPPRPERRDVARDALLDLGTAYARRNYVEQAIGYWRQALAVDGDCLTALCNVGIVELMQRRDPRAALAAFEEYLSRAQSMSGPLPSDQIYYRHLYVPHQVFVLRGELGLPTEAPPDGAGSSSPAAADVEASGAAAVSRF